MLARYSNIEMTALWSERNKKETWHEVEVASLHAQEILELVPIGTFEEVRKVVIDKALLEKADKLEEKSDHDLDAFTKAVSEKLSHSLYHRGMTSYDTEDTALAIILVQSLDVIIKDVRELRDCIYERALEHKNTLQVGRTHFIHGEPITFGFQLLGWVDILDRHLVRIKIAKEECRVGKISGAMGTYSIDPVVELRACEDLGLKAAKHSTQIVSRDILFHTTCTLAGLANSVRRFAVDIRLMASTDLSEVTEFKKPGAVGSSAMPHKSILRNPIKSENVCGIGADVMSKIDVAEKCEDQWFQRVLVNSSAERIYLPDLFVHLDFLLRRFANTIKTMLVYPKQMLRNLWKTGGLVFSQQVLLALTNSEHANYMTRPQAQDLLINIGNELEYGIYETEDGKTFKDLVYKNEAIRAILSEQDLDQCFDPQNAIKYVPEIFARFEKKTI